MASLIECTLTWTDHSSGVQDETSQEIQLYTDSPSFVPDTPIDYSVAPHPWMSLPALASGVTTAAFTLELPVTYIKFRVRQLNADGPGSWDVAAGTRVEIEAPTGSNPPPAPSGTTLAVTTPGPVVILPPPPPPPPPPDTQPGTTTTYRFTDQFSGVQGQDQWFYRDSSGANMTYDSVAAKWSGDELYLAIWNGGFRHSSSGTIKDAVLRWVAPFGGTAAVSGTVQLYTEPGNVRFIVRHNGTAQFTSTDMTTVTPEPYSFTVTVAPGDTLDFVSQRTTGANNVNNISLNPVIQLTTGGPPPALPNPTVVSLTPNPVSLQIGTSATLTVALSNAYELPVSVALTSTAPSVISVPASVTVVAGNTTGAFTASGLSAGSATITASYNSSSATSSGVIASSTAFPNQPPGLTVIRDTSFSAIPQDGWAYNYPTYNPGAGIVTDSTAPYSPNTVSMQRFPAGLVGGNGGGYGAVWTDLGGPHEVTYYGFYFKTDPNYEQHPVMTKLAWFQVPSNNIFITLVGQSSFNIALAWQWADADANNSHLGYTGSGQIYGSQAFSRGQWILVEVLYKPSTTKTSQDGVFKSWVNGAYNGGTMALNTPDGYATGRLKTWYASNLTIWGGTGSTKTRDSNLYWDHWRIAVGNSL